jgi:hypothetical protein
VDGDHASQLFSAWPGQGRPDLSGPTSRWVWWESRGAFRPLRGRLPEGNVSQARTGTSDAFPYAKIFEDLVGTMKRLGKCEDIRSIGALLYRMMGVTKKHLAEVEHGAECVEP